jgi:hypothetical protein
MDCPGRHSLLSRLELAFDGPPSQELAYRVVRHQALAAPLRLEVHGAGISGSVGAFFLSPPPEQARAAEVARLVRPGEFSGQNALVVGGSRGLGEVAAKILAAGGAKMTLSYHRGEADARRVAADIAEAGGSCGVTALDVTDAPGTRAALQSLTPRPSHVYYFATPHIAVNRSGVFDQSLHRTFLRHYADAFTELCVSLATPGPVRVFYPSTVFIEAPPKDLAEYARAKAAGEAVCQALARRHPHLSFVVQRLPRLRTDQNQGLLSRQSADPLPILLAAVREMNTPTKESADHA